jgi:hypothetical protein
MPAYLALYLFGDQNFIVKTLKELHETRRRVRRVARNECPSDADASLLKLRLEDI